jgi:carbon monoxide dehydrogenase subunit G
MKLDDTFTLTAPRAEVWNYLLDVKKVARCIPGAESVEQIDDNHYKGTLVVQLGPVKPKFIGDVTITDMVEPERMTGFFRAKDRGAGSNISAQFVFSLAETEPTVTSAHYNCDLVIRGRMAAFGSSVIIETAKQLTAAFAASLQEELNAPDPTNGVFPAEATPETAPGAAASTRPRTLSRDDLLQVRMGSLHGKAVANVSSRRRQYAWLTNAQFREFIPE